MTPSPSRFRLHPALPLVWEDADTLRVGFEHPHARLNAASPNAQTIVTLLLRGATMAELDAVHPEVATRALEAFAPVLVREDPGGPAGRASATPGVATTPDTRPTAAASRAPSSRAPSSPAPSSRAPSLPAPSSPATASRSILPPSTPTSPALPPRRGAPLRRSRPAPRSSPGAEQLRIRLNDDGRAVPPLLAALKLDPARVFVRGGTAPALAIEVLRFLEPLGRTRRWLGARIPHLLIRFTDTAARVGPLVSADGAPCHGCETLHLTQEDPALPALASQLYGRVPASEAPAVAQLAGAFASHFVDAWRAGHSWVHHHQVAIPLPLSEDSAVPAFPTVTRLDTHPECGCAISTEPLPPPRNEKAASLPAPHSQSQRAAAGRGLV